MLTVIRAARHGAGARTIALALAITPDLTMFIGLSRRLAHRQLAPAAGPFYNTAHRGRGSLALLAANASWPGSFALVAGMRTPEGFRRD